MRKSRTDEIFNDLLTLEQLKRIVNNEDVGLLFCFGTSFISQVIQAKTRLYTGEVVPSHVAIIHKGFIYESTTEEVKVNKKTIPSGVRRWLLKDFYKSEARKDTLYYFSTAVDISLEALENNIHRPYGRDTIVDYLLTDKSKGKSNGLICSQYANMVSGVILKNCVTPAELYRATKKIETKETNNETI